LRIYRKLGEIREIKKPVVTIGTFDGVHLGHQKIITQINEEAKIIGGESVLITFYPHPRMVLQPESHNLKLLQTQSEKLSKLEKLGLQNVIEIPFTIDFANLSAIAFVQDILVKTLNISKIVIGHDHQFGKDREGNIKFLKSISLTFNFEVIEIPPLVIHDINISSTKIRNAIKDGEITKVSEYLGESYSLSGTVVKGKQLGRMLGFPTANIELNNNYKLVPRFGVYAVEVMVLGIKYFGMANIGLRPTINDGLGETIEVHIFDFSTDIYNQSVKVFFHYKIREELKFENKEQLINQLHQDEKTIRDFFNRYKG
jgi:riboflavin kinase/FMN adenylyltransferase